MPYPIYTIYCIQQRSSQRAYVGLTRRSLEERLRFHRIEAKHRGVHPGGLATAIRAVMQAGQAFEDDFHCKALEVFQGGPELAREREAYWVDRLATRYPNGFNIQPGGSSVGSIDNAIAVQCQYQGQTYSFESISEAILWSYQHQAEPVHESAVRWRLKKGAPLEQALGLKPYPDQRQWRTPFLFKGQWYHSLAPISRQTGVPIATLRSRLQRARNQGQEDYDLAKALPKCPVAAAQLPHPFDPQQDGLTAKQFQALTGIAQTTLSARFKRWQQRHPVINRDSLLAYLLKGEPRAQQIDCQIQGQRFSGSINRLAAWVAQSNTLKKQRQLGYSRLRKRLQLLFQTESSPTPDQIRAALALIETPL